MRRILLAAVVLAAGCSDALEQTSSAGQVVAVVSDPENSVSFVSATDFSIETVGMQTRTAVTSAAGRGTVVLVLLGLIDSLAVVRTPGYCTVGLCVPQVVLLPLAPGSGASACSMIRARVGGTSGTAAASDGGGRESTWRISVTVRSARGERPASAW